MSNTIRTKISLRKDIVSNWTNANPTLANGELAIVILDDGTENIKLGNGLSSFNELQYLYQNKLSSDSIYSNELHSTDVITKSIAQGINVKATPTSLATGVYAEADGNFDVVHGVEAKAKEGDDYAFVYNGNDQLEISQRYTSHGKGTFNINSLSGLSGIYLGEKSVFDILNDYATNSYVQQTFCTSAQVSAIVEAMISKSLNIE